jgi:hypothetical protein
MISAALKVAVAVWERHYQVAEWRYWLGLAVALTVAVVGLFFGIYASLFDGEAFDRPFVGGITLSTINILFIGVCVVGIGRWKRDRRRARGGLVVPYFHEFAGASKRGEDARLVILHALQENLDEEQMGRVYPINAVIDLQHKTQAARILKTLKAEGLVHGRVVDRQGGGWTVHARLALPAWAGLTHYDWHTNDATRAKLPWRAWFSGLPSTFDVSDEEFPLDLSADLEALVRGIFAATVLDDSEMAQTALREAIEKSGDSHRPAIDAMRMKLALLVFFGGNEDGALDVLRARIADGDAFGELLRGFAFLAGLRRDQIHHQLQAVGEIVDIDGELEEIDAAIEAERREEMNALSPEQRRKLERAEQLEQEAERLYDEAYESETDETDEGEGNKDEDDFAAQEREYARLRALFKTLGEEKLSALRVAAEDTNDPRSEVSLYNLITELLSSTGAKDDAGQDEAVRQTRAEAWQKLDELRERSSYYRGTWYVKRLCGLRAWLEFRSISAEHRAHSPEGMAAATEAAKWYSKAIRARPRFGLWRFGDEKLRRRYRPRSLRSPILDANAFDAHFYAGHKRRARYHEWRFQRRRRALVRAGFSDLRRGYLSLAHTKLQWTMVGRHAPEEKRRDAFEAVAGAAFEKIEALPREAADDNWTEESNVTSVEFSDGTVIVTAEDDSIEPD